MHHFLFTVWVKQIRSMPTGGHDLSRLQSCIWQFLNCSGLDTVVRVGWSHPGFFSQPHEHAGQLIYTQRNSSVPDVVVNRKCPTGLQVVFSSGGILLRYFSSEETGHRELPGSSNIAPLRPPVGFCGFYIKCHREIFCTIFVSLQFKRVWLKLSITLLPSSCKV